METMKQNRKFKAEIKDKVSIIIPVYNGEQYIEACLHSILEQTYSNIEIICINDGSTDTSRQILDDYHKKYPRQVFVYHQENQGIGNTRNRGIKEATGKYLMFADNDDTLQSDYVERMVTEIDREQADMAIAGYRKIREDGSVLEEERMEVSYPWNKFRMMAPWTKIIRKDVVVKYGIAFGEIPLGEDSVFSMAAINCCEKIIYVDCAGYNWIEHKTSVSNTVQKSDAINATIVMERIIAQNLPLHNLKPQELDYFVYKFLVWHLLYTRKTITRKAWDNLKIRYFTWLEEHNRLYQTKKIPFLEPKGEKLAIRGLLYLLCTPFKNIVLKLVYRM